MPLSRKRLTALCGTAIAFGISSASMAATISYDDFAEGAHVSDLGVAQATAWKNFSPSDGSGTEGYFGTKSDNGITGVGVQGGAAGNEIDFEPGDAITIDFTEGADSLGATVISAITLGLLFNGPEWGDGGEIALVSAHLGGAVVGEGTLTVTGEDTAAWSTLAGTGSVSNCGATSISGPGCFQLLNPFGFSEVDKLSFWASDNETPNNSDYVIESIRVPTPGTFALLGIGLVGAAAVRRRRKHS